MDVEWSVTAEEARLEYSAGRLAGARDGFVVGAWIVIGAIACLSALAQPRLLILAVAGSLVVLLWQRQLSSVELIPWVLSITGTAVELRSTPQQERVHRDETKTARIRWRPGPRIALRILELRGAAGETLAEISVPPEHVGALRSALLSFGWPVSD